MISMPECSKYGLSTTFEPPESIMFGTLLLPIQPSSDVINCQTSMSENATLIVRINDLIHALVSVERSKRVDELLS